MCVCVSHECARVCVCVLPCASVPVLGLVGAPPVKEHTRVSTHADTSMYTYTYIYMQMYIFLRTCIYMYIHTYIHTHAYTPAGFGGGAPMGRCGADPMGFGGALVGFGGATPAGFTGAAGGALVGVFEILISSYG